MINLLPIQQKEELLEEKKLKLVLILGITILAALFSLFLILFSVKTSVKGEVELQKVLIEQKDLQIPQQKILEERIKSLNLTLSELSSFYQREISLVDILETISKTLPKRTYLNTLNFSRPPKTEEKYRGQISLSGYAPSRETLLELKKNLESQDSFSGVYFPPANWVTPTDIIFTVNFKVR